MMRRWLVRFGVVSVLAGLVVGALPVFAQVAALDQSFVAAPDGSVWLVLGPTRHQVTPGPISAADFARLQPGAPVANLADINRLLQAPVPANPAQPLVGKTTAVCSTNPPLPLAVTVLDAQWLKTVGGNDAAGMWVVVVANAVNQGNASASLYQATLLRDERGRTWADVTGTATALAIGYEDLAQQQGAVPANRQIAPGATQRVLLVYPVAEDPQTLELVAARPGC